MQSSKRKRWSGKSTRPTTFDFNRLAPEILDLIIAQLNRKNLKRARLVNRTWQSSATKHLFQVVTLFPTKSGVRYWKRITHHATLCSVPRRAFVYSAPVPYYKPWTYSGRSREYQVMSEWEPHPEKEGYKGFYSEINSLALLSNLQDVYLHFTANCATSQSDAEYEEGTETSEFRVDFLKRFFAALKTRQDKADFPKVRNLTIHNLQNIPIPEFTSSELFKVVMKDVEHFNLMITHQTTELAEEDIYMKERRTFMPHLEDQWLKPWSHLKSLTLYFQESWGPLPGYFSGQSLEFPSLEKLTLGRYCLAHNDSLDWILRQKSIKSLRLQNCVIVSYLIFQKADLESWKVPTHDWSPFTEGYSDENLVTYHFSGTWEDAFDRIRTRLGNLIDFRFHVDTRYVGFDEIGSEIDFDTPELLATSLSPRRYTVFDIEKFSPWVKTPDSGMLIFGDDDSESDGVEREGGPSKRPTLNRHNETMEGDDRALNDLMKTTSDRFNGRTGLSRVLIPYREAI